MSNRLENYSLIGVLFGLLAAFSTLSMAEEEYKAGYLLDKTGKPVAAKYEDCIKTPKQEHNAEIAQRCTGLLDSDGDGVTDDKDKCPDTPEGIKVDAHGCPMDTDGDGVPDYKDKCPGTSAGVEVDEHGCPLDTDGDGVPDYKDKCPATPPGLKVDEHGCPPDLRVILTEEMVNFDFDKSVIKSSGKNVLDRLAEEINENLATIREIKVVGHTDSDGTEAYNQSLSERRAKAVVDYLVSKGVPADRIYSTGKGENHPIDSNATEEGRARNRRTEIDVRRIKE